MKIFTLFLYISLHFFNLYAQNNPYDYPDTLWMYGISSDKNYGRTAKNPIRVGRGMFPKNNYRYLNSLTDKKGKPIKYTRNGSFNNPNTSSGGPLTGFTIETSDGETFMIFFDQYVYEKPLIIKGFTWTERRTGYYGEFKNDSIFEGKGIYFFEEGGYYKGEWENGIMQGKGEMVVKDVEKYVGDFIAGQYTGKGKLWYADGGCYEGEFLNGDRHGLGKLYYPPGDNIKYMEGNFQNNKPTGEFIITYSNGKKEKQTF